MPHVIALVDFTRVSEAAIAQAGRIARTAYAKLTLLHVAPEDQQDSRENLISELNVSAEVLGKKPIQMELHVEFGDFQTVIGDLLVRLKADMVVIGTHGIRGIQRNLFSKNIAKLMKDMRLPALVVQGQRDQAVSDLDNWLLVGMADDEVAKLNWLKDAYNAEWQIAEQNQKVEDIEEEAFEKDSNLIILKNLGDDGVDLVLNSFGIPVLLL